MNHNGFDIHVKKQGGFWVAEVSWVARGSNRSRGRMAKRARSKTEVIEKAKTFIDTALVREFEVFEPVTSPKDMLTVSDEFERLSRGEGA